MKTAIIFGIAGQDGAYLSELLLNKGYKVIGVSRRSGSNNWWRLKELNIFNHINLKLEFCDITEVYSVQNLIKKVCPDECYNLAANSFVTQSFLEPISTNMINYIGHLHILEAIKNHSPKTKLYFAGSSEQFGDALEIPQTEKTPFNPRSPYAVSKCASFQATKNYRESYNLFTCSGILMNHESPLRGSEFITKKIVEHVSKFNYNKNIIPLQIGNLNSKRDWGFAKEYVYAQWLMLQQEKADDYVIATNETHTVREFIEKSFEYINEFIVWQGKEDNEKGYNKEGKLLVEVNPEFYRPAEVNILLGDYSKAKELLQWKPVVTFTDLVMLMMKRDLERQRI